VNLAPAATIQPRHRVRKPANRELVARAKAGSGEAFASLYEEHKKRVFSLCVLMTGDTTEAEDLTQEAFIQVFRKLNTFRGDSAFSTWLYRVAFNTVLMRLRRNRNHQQVSLDEPVRLDSSLVQRDFGRHDSDLLGTVDRLVLARAISELPRGCRTIFVLHEVEGYEHHEIARRLRCSVGNSKSQLHKAKLKLRDCLQRRQAETETQELPVDKQFLNVTRAPLAPWEVLVLNDASATRG
jgi:RNA polymerase sigma-70 factor, ECF subfamily